MPNTYRETTKDGKPWFEVLTGFDRDGNPYWSGIGVKTARALLIENKTAFKEWFKKQTGEEI